MKTIKLIVVFIIMNVLMQNMQAQNTGYIEIQNITGELRPDSLAPEYKGGQNELLKFMQKELKYPRMALELEIEGKVVVQFTITKDSSITNFITLLDRPGGAICPEEVIRVLKLAHEWIPAKRKGKSTSSDYIIAVKFILVRANPPQNNNEEKLEKVIIRNKCI